MAAKQGLTAHISQATDDAKRALINRAPTTLTSHTWLSNLNTTCTIKSAPPRSPEVMTMLSTKSGWLVKRNEQHVWQRRWCCVVPHTFLYYFEAAPRIEYDDDGYGGDHPSGGGGDEVAAAVVDHQDVLNAAVRDGLGGYGNDEQYPYGDIDHPQAPLSPEHPSGAGASGVVGPTAATGSNLQPVGIIDLECYTNVNRTRGHAIGAEGVMELTGDPITNPDLRSFYFQAADTHDAEEWTKALLSDRHTSLKDEREALREVCNTFPLQLKDCAEMIDAAEKRAAEVEKELYRVRSAAEEGRRKSLEAVREILERQCWDGGASETGNGDSAGERNHNHEGDSVRNRLRDRLDSDRRSHLEQLEHALRSPDAVGTMNGGVLPAMTLLTDYVSSVIASYTDLAIELDKAEDKLSTVASIDKSTLERLRSQHKQLERDRLKDRQQYEERNSELEEELRQVQEQLAESDHHLQTQRMEFAMYQSQSKAKVGEIGQHKKILKKEVLDLRSRVDEITSERDAAYVAADNIKASLNTQRQRNVTLERYIARMEKQVEVQHNMMEMMSHNNGSVKDGSILGKVIGGDGADDGENPGSGAVVHGTGPSPYSGRSRKKNQLPPNYKTPDTSSEARGFASSKHTEQRGCAEDNIDESDPLPKKNIDFVESKVDHSLPEKVDGMGSAAAGSSLACNPSSATKETEQITAGTATLQYAEVDSPISSGGEPVTPRTPTIHLEPQSEDDGGRSTPVTGTVDLVKRDAISEIKGILTPTLERSHAENFGNDEVIGGNEAATPSPYHDFTSRFTDQDLHNTIQDYEMSGNGADDYDDAKSHISELTEDRTYKLPPSEQPMSYKISRTERESNNLATSGRGKQPLISNDPPRFILGKEDTHDDKSFISSRSRLEGRPPQGSNIQHRSTPSRRDVPGDDDEGYGEQYDVSSSKRPSVAERARLDADNARNSVIIRTTPDASPRRGRGYERSSHGERARSNSPSNLSRMSRTSFLAKVGKRVIRAVDNSVLGVPNQAGNDNDDSSSQGSRSSSDYNSDESGSSNGDDRSKQFKKEAEIPLHIRQKLQREKQLAFLKQQGIIDDEKQIRGGAGATPVKENGTGSNLNRTSPSATSISSSRSHRISSSDAGKFYDESAF